MKWTERAVKLFAWGFGLSLATALLHGTITALCFIAGLLGLALFVPAIVLDCVILSRSR